MRTSILAIVVTGMISAVCHGQMNVQAWHAAGQTWIVWETTGFDPVTYDIYKSPVPVTSVADMQPIGRVLREEWGAARLRLLHNSARWRVPLPGGGTHLLYDNEGLFVHTPHAPAVEYFVVVKHGEHAVDYTNITGAPVIQTYDPVNDPVRPHVQFSGITASNRRTNVYAMWADGRDDHTSGRPDFPVMANAAKSGVGHLFYITEPPGGVGVGPYPAALALHGGGGEYQNFRPDAASHTAMQMALTEGILITPDDTIFYREVGQTVRTGTRWFGYVSNFDPFTDEPRTNPPNGSMVIDYTARRMNWILDRALEPAGAVTSLGFNVDATRVSMVGHSGGANGTGILGRLSPDRFSALIMYTPGIGLDGTLDMCCFPLGGSHAQNLPTNVIGPSGQPLRFTDLLFVMNRLSATQRDYPVLRIFSGRGDNVSSATWSPLLVDQLRTIDNSGVGAMIFWDQRVHGVAQWHLPPAGQWVAPQMSQRASVQYLTRYRSDQTYPGFFNVDQDPLGAGQQPEIGNGHPQDGDAWGTWGGYIEWDVNSIIDSPEQWACDLWLVGLSPVLVDNCPVHHVMGNVALRKTQQFHPRSGIPLKWTLTRRADGVLLQAGNITPNLENLVQMHGLQILRDPQRVRLSVSINDCPADIDGSGSVGVADLLSVIGTWGPCPLAPQSCTADIAPVGGDGFVGVADLLMIINGWGSCRP